MPISAVLKSPLLSVNVKLWPCPTCPTPNLRHFLRQGLDIWPQRHTGCAWHPTRAQLLWPSHSTRSFFHGSLPLSSHHDMIWGCSLTSPRAETKNETVPTWQSCRTASGISMHFLDFVFFGRISYISFQSETESAVLRCVIRWSRVQFCWEGNSQPLGHHLGQRGRKGSTTREASLDARMPPSQDSCRAPVQMIATRPCQHPSSDKPTYRRV